MENTTEEIMKRMFLAVNENYEKTIEDNKDKFSEILIQLNLLEAFKEIMDNEKIKDVMNEVFHDMVSSVYMASNGMYRNAYICLRSAIELSNACVYFLDHNYDFLLWQMNEYDVKWSILDNHENGVLSEKYLQLFVDSTEISLLIERIEYIYHLCSEYVHGKYSFMQTNFMKETIKYDEDYFKKWNDCWLEEAKVISLLWSIRLNSKLVNLGNEDISQIKENSKDLDMKGIVK